MVSDAIHPYHRGGKELRYHELTRRLSRDADVHVYTMNWWNGPGRWPSRTDDSGVTYHAISRLVPLYAGQRRSLWQAAWFGLACARLLRRDFDILEADHIPFAQVIVLRLVALAKRRPFVATWHEVWGREYWREYLGALGGLAALVEGLAMRLPDRIIAASPQTAERLEHALSGSRPVTVVPNGIDLDAVAAVYPSPDPVDVVVVGRLMPHKRVSRLLEAIALLNREGLALTCRIVGNGPERDALHTRARELGIEKLTDFRHDVGEQKDVYSLIKSARVCVFPSAREGFGIAVLEALACGVPVITTSAPDNLARHLVARASRGVVCESTPAALADAIRDVLASPAEPGGADPWLREYSWDAMADRVKEALEI